MNNDTYLGALVSTPEQILEQTISVINNYYSTLEALGSKSLEYKNLYDKYVNLSIIDAELLKDRMKETIVKALRLNELR